MDLAQKYAYAVFRNGSFSKAAKQLFISQPSLSETVKKLEKNLGFSLFDRSKSPLALTPQGVLYMEYLKEAFENERVMLSRIKSISGTSRKELAITGGSFLSRMLLPRACREFLKIHSDVDVKLDFKDGMPLHNNFNSDFNFSVQYSYNNHHMICIPLLEEQYFLAFTNECAGAELLKPLAIGIDDVVNGDKFTPDTRLYDIPPQNLQIILRDLQINSPELESYVNKIPRSPCRIVNTRHRGIYYDLMLMGIGAIFTTDIIATIERHRSKNVLFVPIDNKRTLHVTYKEDRVLSEEEKNFIYALQQVSHKATFL